MDTETQLGSGLRYNEGKVRFDLINPLGLRGLAEVLTAGSIKYEDHNWEKGMAWSKVIASLKRHTNAMEAGEDYDAESGLLHADHIQANAHFLSTYYRIFPQGDDRYLVHRDKPKIGLDIDEVICDWVSAWIEFYGMEVPTSWFFDSHIMQRFEKMKYDGVLDDFYLNLEPKCKPEDIPFEPHCYVTSRPVDTKVTEEWLRRNNFPMRPVITVPAGTSKVDVLKKAGVDIFVDDRYENFEELNRNGICCFLFDAPHNQRYNVGFKRIKSLSELM